MNHNEFKRAIAATLYTLVIVALCVLWGLALASLCEGC